MLISLLQINSEQAEGATSRTVFSSVASGQSIFCEKHKTTVPGVFMNTIFANMLWKILSSYCLLLILVFIHAHSIPSTLTFLTYNLDGLNPIEAQKRTKYAMKLMLKHRPDIVHMQELTFYTVIQIKPLFERKNYNCSDAESKSVFSMTCVEKAYSTNIAFRKKKFTGQAKSNQGKDMLISTFRLGSLEYTFINTQLESLAIGSAIRKAQFAQTIRELVHYQSHGPAILSGDFHLRDDIFRFVLNRVLDQVNEGISNSSMTSQHQNQNHPMVFDAAEVAHPNQPLNATYFHPDQPSNHHRYDRVYCNEQWRVISYETIGDEQVLQAHEKSPYKTISDHRGVVVEVEVVSPTM